MLTYSKVRASFWSSQIEYFSVWSGHNAFIWQTRRQQANTKISSHKKSEEICVCVFFFSFVCKISNALEFKLTELKWFRFFFAPEKQITGMRQRTWIVLIYKGCFTYIIKLNARRIKKEHHRVNTQWTFACSGWRWCPQNDFICFSTIQFFYFSTE